MAELGRAALLVALGLVVYAAVAGGWAAHRRLRRLAVSAQNALLAAFVATLVASAVLLAALWRRDFGFVYKATPAGFDHVLQVTLIDAEGRIVRQVYGAEITPDDLGKPLTLMLANRPLPLQSGLDALIDRVRILCTVYDPDTGTYRVNYGLALEVAGGVTFALAMLFYMLGEWRARRAARRAAGRSSRA